MQNCDKSKLILTQFWRWTQIRVYWTQITIFWTQIQFVGHIFSVFFIHTSQFPSSCVLLAIGHVRYIIVQLYLQYTSEWDSPFL